MGRIHPAFRPAALVSSAAVAAALAVLAGCAAVEPPTSSSTTAAASTTPPTSTGDRTAAPFVSDATTDACVDGIAWMTFHDDDPSEKSLPGGCDTVVVAGVDGTLHSGPARVVVVMGSGNHVEVETVAQVDVEGVDNEVVHGSDSDPVVNTDGTGNTVTAR
ncbi:DUF3060 domain-containing protein [Frigoribacterium sp. PhB116]|uniref:DUF3060 domain-containing protein n=1 Tax=Frigoribacterium sp. PhB116 TaxID=2485174 RepID=UPI00105C5C02|nr:DUF3060 domain-containing protein [Frigoribacterium sp. PhB116]TDT63036.1 DUF3060 family protein [Frigoribacterium sp. PhB116]